MSHLCPDVALNTRLGCGSNECVARSPLGSGFKGGHWAHWRILSGLGPGAYFTNGCSHDDVIKWKLFPHNWSFVRGIHRPPVNSPHKGQRRGALMFSLICARINGWVNNREAGELRRYRAHYNVIVMHWILNSMEISLHSSRSLQIKGSKILHMAGKLCCRGMCKNFAIWRRIIDSKAIFQSNLNCEQNRKWNGAHEPDYNPLRRLICDKIPRKIPERDW